MKKALINTLDNNKIVDFHDAGFEVAHGLQWVDCADDVTHEHLYDGVNFAPYIKTQAELNAENKEQAVADLLLIDAGSIRALREYIASQPDAPQWLKDKDAAAVLARSKLK